MLLDTFIFNHIFILTRQIHDFKYKASFLKK